ncbi:hypothetical protein AYI68_g6871, partial [Smittium mucronatum]
MYASICQLFAVSVLSLRVPVKEPPQTISRSVVLFLVGSSGDSAQRCTILEEDHLETGGTDRLAQLRHSLVHKSSVRQSDGSQRLTAICRKAMSINPTFG